MANLQSVLNFDGNDDYIEVSYKPELNPAQFTLSCWAKVDGGQGQWRSPVTSRTARGSQELGGYILYAGNNNKWQFWTGDGSRWISVIGSDVVLNTWTHVAITYDGNTMTLYINGKQVGDKVKSNIHINSNCPVRIGAGITEGNPGFFFNGQIAEVCLWNQVNSQDQIEQSMNYRLRGNEQGLVAYWPLNEGSGNTVQDRSSNNNNGTINGATWEEAELPITNQQQTLGTGLQDYGYWRRWQQNLPEPTDSKPFRRGRIWA